MCSTHMIIVYIFRHFYTPSQLASNTRYHLTIKTLHVLCDIFNAGRLMSCIENNKYNRTNVNIQSYNSYLGFLLILLSIDWSCVRACGRKFQLNRHVYQLPKARCTFFHNIIGWSTLHVCTGARRKKEKCLKICRRFILHCKSPWCRNFVVLFYTVYPIYFIVFSIILCKNIQNFQNKFFI